MSKQQTMENELDYERNDSNFDSMQFNQLLDNDITDINLLK